MSHGATGVCNALALPRSVRYAVKMTSIAHHYGAALADIHHGYFGSLAEGASSVVIQRLRAHGLRTGAVVDLACGSAPLCQRVITEGYTAYGVDISRSMIDLAKKQSPAAHLQVGSLWDYPIPSCVAVCAIGEALSYAAHQVVSLSQLEQLITNVSTALCSRGLFLFDICVPGRSGPTGHRSRFWSREGVYLGLEEREDMQAGRVSRDITIFRPNNNHYEKIEEHHTLICFQPEIVEAMLKNNGFTVDRLDAYDGHVLPSGVTAFLAEKQ